jgi:hypothetical protein
MNKTAYVAGYVVLALIAVAGSAQAIPNNSVNSKDIVNGSVRSVDLRDNGVTGRDVNESTLAMVPSAASVAGKVIKTFRKKVTVTETASHELFRVGPVFLAGQCDLAGAPPTGRMYIRNTGAGGATVIGNYLVTHTVALNAFQTSALTSVAPGLLVLESPVPAAQGTATFSSPSGAVYTITASVLVEPGQSCLYSGTVTGG